MKFNYITDTYKEKNEDSYGYTKHSFWISDGASSLNKNNFTPEQNDVHFIVNWWNKYLTNHLDNLNETIIEILENGIRVLNKEFSQYANINNLSKLDRTSLGIAISRINKTKLECYVLGDVEINLLFKDNNTQTLTDYSIQALDQQVISLMTNNLNRNNELVFKGFTTKELKLLQDNRKKMNTSDGYYILEHCVEAIKYGIYKVFEIKDLNNVLMVTDGFALLNKQYSKLELFNEFRSRGVENLLQELREIEDTDINMRNHQRLKAHDDATALFIEF